MLDDFDAGAGRGVHHLLRDGEAALVIDADFGDDERRMRGADPPAGDRDLWASSAIGDRRRPRKNFSIRSWSSPIDFAEFTPMRNCAPPSKPLVYQEHSARILLMTQRSRPTASR